jgi:hypothetical protein
MPATTDFPVRQKKLDFRRAPPRSPPRARIIFARRFNRIGGPSPPNKIFHSRFSEKLVLCAHPALQRGALRPIVTNVGCGMRWTFLARNDEAR